MQIVYIGDRIDITNVGERPSLTFAVLDSVRECSEIVAVELLREIVFTTDSCALLSPPCFCPSDILLFFNENFLRSIVSIFCFLVVTF